MADSSKQFLCAACNGTGALGYRRCTVCGGIGQGSWRNGEFLYWGARLDRASIVLAKVRAAIHLAVNVILGAAAFGGLAALAVVLKQAGALTLALSFWRIPDPLLFLFWTSVWLDLYLIYRLVVAKASRRGLRRRLVPAAETVLPPADWAGVRRLSKNKIVDVSAVFHAEATKAVLNAFSLANKFKHRETRQIHLFAALTSSSKIRLLLGRLGINPDALRERVINALADEPARQNLTVISPALLEVFFRAYEEAVKSRVPAVDVTELLLALMTEEGRVRDILYDLAIDERKARNAVGWIRVNELLRARVKRGRALASLRSKSEAGRAMTGLATPFLDGFSEDLTALARAGATPVVVAREKEMEEIFRVFEGGRESIILVGHHGVGKDALLEGLAERMVEEDVPKILSDKRLVALSIPKLISGATAAEAAERLMHIFYEAARARNIILAVPNIEGLVGLTSGAAESIDLADIFGSELAKKYFLAIATTNPAKFTKLVESSKLGNVFQKIAINEVDDDGAIQILEAKAGGIEYQNRVFFSYDALDKAVTLSRRYIHERYLPEKAIELIKEAAHDVRKRKGENSVVLGDDVSRIVAEKTRIPVTEVTASESAKLLNLEERLRERVVGQTEAVKAVAAAIRRARAELREASRPIANFLFLGPTGVGKTELAKTVAEVYFGREEAMTRLDMSEYQDSSSLARLIGAGGAKEGGLLTEAVRKNPFTLLLLDEIEKAHPDILNVFLQVMDDGRLTDNAGRTIDFTSVILIATSNAASQFVQDELRKSTPLPGIKEALLNKELRSYFRPEFLNRFDGIIVFTPLSKDEIEQVAWLMIGKVQKQLETKGIVLHVTDEAARELAAAGFDPVFGARPLRRVIQEKVQDALASFLLQKKIGRRDVVVLESGGTIRIEKAAKL